MSEYSAILCKGLMSSHKLKYLSISVSGDFEFWRDGCCLTKASAEKKTTMTSTSIKKLKIIDGADL